MLVSVYRAVLKLSMHSVQGEDFKFMKFEETHEGTIPEINKITESYGLCGVTETILEAHGVDKVTKTKVQVQLQELTLQFIRQEMRK